MSYNLKNAKLFPWWCNKVLPLVYDDSLSYYEVLCKIMETLKDLIEVEELQNNAITDLDNRTTSLEGRMDTAESDIDALEGRMYTAESDIDNLEGRMDTAEGDIDALEGRMTTAEGDIDNLETRMTTAEGDIDSLEGRMTTAENDIDGLEGRVTTAEGDIDNLETRMTTAEGDIDAVEGRMTTAEGDIDSLETRMTTAEGDIDTLEGSMGTAQDDIRTLRRDYTVLNGNVESLEAKTYSHGFGIGNNDTNVGRTALTRALFYNGQMIDGMSEDTSIGRYHDYANNTDVDGEYWETDYIPLCNKGIDEIGRTFYVMNPMGVDNKPVMIYCFANNDVGGMYAWYEYKSAISPSDLTEYSTPAYGSNFKVWKFTVPTNSNAIKIVFNTTYIPGSQISGSDYNVGTNVGYLSHSLNCFSHFTSAPYMLQNFQTAYCDILKYPIFNCTTTYNAGDIVRKGWKLYRAKVNVPATSYFDSSPITGAWELITVKEIIGDIKAAQSRLNIHQAQLNGYKIADKMTQAEYNALTVKDPKTLYPIVG